ELVNEQAALRRVATLVARESSPDHLFAVVAEQVALVFDVPQVRLVRYVPEGSVVVGGFSEGGRERLPIGSRCPVDGPGVLATVRQTGRPARDEDDAQTRELAAGAPGAGIRSAVASPIVVERRLWGAMVVLSQQDEPLPEDTEARLTDFTELVATAIANADSRGALARVVDEQSALRRVATRVAEGATRAEIFSAVSDEVATLFHTDMVVIGRFDGEPVGLLVVGVGDGTDEPVVGSRWQLDDALTATAVYRTGLPARFDHDSTIADPDVAAIVERFRPAATVAVPIKVEGRLWGAMIVSTRDAPLPADTEERLQRFTDLIATALADAEARAEVERLAEEQAALRRVATLVAQGARPNDVFRVVSDEVARLFGTRLAAVGRFEPDGQTLDVVGADRLLERWQLADFMASAEVLRTGRSARADAARWASAAGETAERLRSLGIVSTVASPIVVEGALWGTMLVASTDEVLRPDSEQRLEAFTELLATAIANTESRDARARLSEQQAALRQVATLVAEGEPPAGICSTVCEEVGRLLGADMTGMLRFPGDGTAIAIASWSAGGSPVPAVGTQTALAPEGIAARILSTGATARRDSYAEVGREIGELANVLGQESTVGAPIRVGGRVWGALMAASRRRAPWAAEAEAGLAEFTQLVETAIANSESRAAVERLADEQAALWRVATLVAEAAPPAEISSAVSNEVAKLFRTDLVVVSKIDGDPVALVVVGVGDGTEEPVVGSRWKLDDALPSTAVYRTGLPARFDHHHRTVADPDHEAIMKRFRPTSAVAVPIRVEGRLWGAMIVSTRAALLPTDTEERLQRFTDLIATALANAEARAEVERLAEEQAALRQVAVLVAQQPSPSEVFTAVTKTVGLLLGADYAALRVFSGDDTATMIASWSG
ncbi:MAG: hypothetical protein QOE98_415, partial [Gaiellaceae bacterium]|nr:hypothetical protein [Gaiellaceae bacterium]